MGATLSADLKAWAAFCPGGNLADEDVGLPPPSVSPLRMSIDLQRKLGRGVNVNLKLLIRGDLQTGKTSMWRRLQGLSYVARVEPSRELGVATLDWKCDTSPDQVKVSDGHCVDLPFPQPCKQALHIERCASAVP